MLLATVSWQTLVSQVKLLTIKVNYHIIFFRLINLLAELVNKLLGDALFLVHPISQVSSRVVTTLTKIINVN